MWVRVYCDEIEQGPQLCSVLPESDLRKHQINRSEALYKIPDSYFKVKYNEDQGTPPNWRRLRTQDNKCSVRERTAETEEPVECLQLS